MVPIAYHSFFGDAAEVAGTLIGLLFVAVSVSPDKLGGTDIDFEVKAGIAFAALTNALVMALVALLPGVDLATPGIVLAAGGISSSVGLGAISFRHPGHRRRLRMLLRVGALLALFVVQLVYSVQLGDQPLRTGPIQVEGILIVASFAFAIERAWELVGVGSTGAVQGFVRLLSDRRPVPADDEQGPRNPPGSGAP